MECLNESAKPERKSEVQNQMDGFRMQLGRAKQVQEAIKACFGSVLRREADSSGEQEEVIKDGPALTQHAAELRDMANALCSLNDKWDVIHKSIEL